MQTRRPPIGIRSLPAHLVPAATATRKIVRFSQRGYRTCNVAATRPHAQHAYLQCLNFASGSQAQSSRSRSSGTVSSERPASIPVSRVMARAAGAMEVAAAVAAVSEPVSARTATIWALATLAQTTSVSVTSTWVTLTGAISTSSMTPVRPSAASRPTKPARRRGTPSSATGGPTARWPRRWCSTATAAPSTRSTRCPATGSAGTRGRRSLRQARFERAG